MKTGENGKSIIKFYEQLHDGNLMKIGLQPKEDPIGLWTVGYGRPLRDIDGSYLKGISGYQRMLDIYPDLETITIEEADDLLEEDLERFETQLNSLNLNLSQQQFDALISLIFNIGFGNFLSSTLLRRIRGKNGSITDAFMMWVKAGGKTLRGLQLRRKTEATLYETGNLIF